MKHAAAFHDKIVHGSLRRNERNHEFVVFHAAGTCNGVYFPSFELVEFFLMLLHKYGSVFHSGTCDPGHSRHHNPDYGIRAGKWAESLIS